jgi:hypothetical protein
MSIKINATVQFDSAKLFLVDNCFDSTTLRDINGLFSDRDTGWAADPIFAHKPGRLMYQNSNTVTQSIDASARVLSDQIGALLGRKIQYQSSSLWLDLPGYAIDPHYDTPGNPEISMQIFVGDPAKVWEMLGTAIYLPEQRRNPLFEMHYRINSGYIMEYPDRILHGLNHHIPAQYVRNSVYLRFASA